MGVGVSGGEEGALKGPCIMAGGPREGYDQISGMLTAVAAKSEGACCQLGSSWCWALCEDGSQWDRVCGNAGNG